MATTPAQYNIRPQRRADYPLTLRFKDPDGVVMDLTGWTVLAQVWTTGRTSKLGDFSVTVATPSSGEVALRLGYSVTAALPDECRWDVMLVNPSGLREYYLEGIVRPSEGYTVPA